MDITLTDAMHVHNNIMINFTQHNYRNITHRQGSIALVPVGVMQYVP